MPIDLTPEQIQQILQPGDYSSLGNELKGLLSSFPELPVDQVRDLANIQQQVNNLGTQGPYGSTSYKQNSDGSYTQVTELSPEQKKLYQQQSALQQGQMGLAQSLMPQVQESLSQPFDLSSLGQQALPQDFQGERARIEDELYGRQEHWIDQQRNQERGQWEQDLASRGIGRGTENYQRELENFDKRWGDRYADARAQAIGIGGQEMQSSYDLSADARARGIQELQLERGQPMAEMQGLLGLSGGAGGYSPMVPQATRGDIDVMGTAMGLANIGSQRQIAGAQGLADMQQAAIEDARARGLFGLGEMNRYDIAQEGNETQLKSASISAGAAGKAAQINADLQRWMYDQDQYNKLPDTIAEGVAEGTWTGEPENLAGLALKTRSSSPATNQRSTGKGSGF